MPLLRQPTIEELEDHFFGSGAFSYGWIDTKPVLGTDGTHFPVWLRTSEYEPGQEDYKEVLVTHTIFTEAIKKYSESLRDRTFDDLIEDMDAVDVDNVFQIILFGEIVYG